MSFTSMYDRRIKDGFLCQLICLFIVVLTYFGHNDFHYLVTALKYPFPCLRLDCATHFHGLYRYVDYDCYIIMAIIIMFFC